MLYDSLVFDDGGGYVVLASPGVVGGKVQSWSAMHHPDEPGTLDKGVRLARQLVDQTRGAEQEGFEVIAGYRSPWQGYC